MEEITDTELWELFTGCGEPSECFNSGRCPNEVLALQWEKVYGKRSISNYPMNPKKRAYFDRQVDWVVRRLPKRILKMLDDIPLHVEDRPSRQQMRELSVEHPNDLCGCFAGLKEEDRYNYQARSPNLITIFRGGIFEAAADEEGFFDTHGLREQIRVTILHELAHFVGFDEDELEELGYG